ncbi:conserved hypothetical protein [Tenacibaculum sp. 190524A05c]
MNKFKQITSVFLSCIILLTHVLILFHTHEHYASHEQDNCISDAHFEQNEVSEQCIICDLYIKKDFDEPHNSIPELTELSNKSKRIVQPEILLVSIKLIQKTSRSPPTILS